MNIEFIILLMIFLHIVDDYYLQGILAQMKQRSWWAKNSRNPKYKYDYIWALIMHSFSWSFMIMLPIAFVNGFAVNLAFICVVAANLIIHSIVDHMKANLRIINLWKDQIIHLVQIFVTAAIFLMPT